MKHVVVAAIALVVGLVLGGLLPRAEVRALEQEVASLEDRPCTSPGVGRDLAGLFRGQPPLVEELPPRPEAEPSKEAQGGFHVEVGGSGEPADPGLGGDVPMSPEDREEALAAVQEAMELRRVQARAALIEDADPSDEQLASFDAAMATMNEELTGLAEGFVAQYQDGREPTRRDMMAFAADTLDVMITAEDQITSVLDADQLAAADPEAYDPFSHVDPGVVDVLWELDLP